jgi:uncharacterized protein YjbI with pentapeptide repeats
MEIFRASDERRTVTTEEVLEAYKDGERDFCRINIVAAKLGGAVLQEIDFSGSCLRETDFRGANLAGADFRGANLVGARFEGANLAGAKFDGALVSKDTSFEGANLQGVSISESNLKEANLKKTVLEWLTLRRDGNEEHDQETKDSNLEFSYLLRKDTDKAKGRVS